MKSSNPFSSSIAPLLGVLVIGGIAFAYSKTNVVPATTTDAGVVTSPVQTTKEQVVPMTTTVSTGTKSAGGTTPAATHAYKNGTYTADGSYQSPESIETITVTLTIKDDIVTAASVSANVSGDSRRYVQSFLNGYKAQVIGKKLNTLNISRVSGSSLTPAGFNAALDTIRAQAAA